MLRDLKSNTSRWIREVFRALSDFAWQDGYGAFSVSCSGIDSVRACMDQQAEHHRTLSFEDEFVRFLQRHGIEYDPAYIWS